MAFPIRPAFQMPDSLSWEEKSLAYSKLFGMTEPVSFLGKPWYLLNRVIVWLTGASLYQAATWLRLSQWRSTKDPLTTSEAPVVVRCMQHNPNWTQRHEGYCVKLSGERVQKIDIHQTPLASFLLCKACKAGDSALSNALMERKDLNINYNATVGNEDPPLISAVRNNDVELVKRLLKQEGIEANKEVLYGYPDLDIRDAAEPFRHNALKAATKLHEVNEEIVNLLIATNAFKRPALLGAFKQLMMNTNVSDSFLNKILTALGGPLNEDELKNLLIGLLSSELPGADIIKRISFCRTHPHDFLNFEEIAEKLNNEASSAMWRNYLGFGAHILDENLIGNLINPNQFEEKLFPTLFQDKETLTFLASYEMQGEPLLSYLHKKFEEECREYSKEDKSKGIQPIKKKSKAEDVSSPEAQQPKENQKEELLVQEPVPTTTKAKDLIRVAKFNYYSKMYQLTKEALSSDK